MGPQFDMPGLGYKTPWNCTDSRPALSGALKDFNDGTLYFNSGAGDSFGSAGHFRDKLGIHGPV